MERETWRLATLEPKTKLGKKPHPDKRVKPLIFGWCVKPAQ